MEVPLETQKATLHVSMLQTAAVASLTTLLSRPIPNVLQRSRLPLLRTFPNCTLSADDAHLTPFPPAHKLTREKLMVPLQEPLRSQFQNAIVAALAVSSLPTDIISRNDAQTDAIITTGKQMHLWKPAKRCTSNPRWYDGE